MLDIEGLVSAWETSIFGEYVAQDSTPTEMAAELKAAYLSYAVTGTAPGVNVAAGGNSSALDSAFFADNTTAILDRMADGLAAYWQTVTTPGAPAHGGTSVVSVEFQAQAPDFKAAIESVITQEAATPGAPRNLLEALEAALKTQTIIVTELVDGSPVEFVENVA